MRLRTVPSVDTLNVRVQTYAMPRQRSHALLAAAAICLAATAAQAGGRPTPLVSGVAALGKARGAWREADFDVAEAAYKEAIDKGGLSRDDVLEAYAHLGAARAIMGRKEDAKAAFRMAAAIDGAFKVPQEAGKKAMALADAARKDVEPFALEANAPGRIESGAAFAVSVKLDPSQLPLLARVGLEVKDGSTAKVYRFEESPQTVVRFRVPATMALPGANLAVRVTAQDGHDNELADASAEVMVGSAPITSTQDAPATPGHSLWSTPWPYVIGGALLAAAGTGLYFAFRPPSEVNVGAARVSGN